MAELERLDKLNIPQMLAQSRQEHASNVAMRYHDGTSFQPLTYIDFYVWVMKAAAALKKAGVKAGDKVAILSENRPEWGATYFASLFLGAINVPLDALLKVPEIGHIIRDSNAKVVVTSKKFYPEIEPLTDIIDTLDHVVAMDQADSPDNYLLREENPETIDPPGTPLNEVSALIYTSGTTGLAKGVMLTHGNITSDIYGSLEYFKLFPTDSFISILPIHHTFECTCGFLLPISSGLSINYARGLASKLIVEDIKSNQATILLGVPLVFEKMFSAMTKKISQKPVVTRAVFHTLSGLSKLLKKTMNVEAGGKLFNSLREKSGMSSLRLMVAGGAPMSPIVAEAFNALGFRLIQGYGLTETSPVLTINPIEAYKNASIGKALKNCEMKIDDPDASGVGEIIVRGPMVMAGYYKNEAATAEVIRDGWLHTGDLARVDSEGYYFISGRKKNLIVTPGGKNVYPEELEFLLSQSPYILEALVLGQPVAGSGGGEEIKAVLVPDLEYFDLRAAEKGITLDDMYIEKTIKLEVSKLSEQLADYKRVKYIVIRSEDFEKTSTKKIKRYLYKQKPMTVHSRSGKKDKK